MLTQQNPQDNLQYTPGKMISLTDENFNQILKAIRNNDPSLTDIELDSFSQSLTNPNEQIRQILIALQQNSTVIKLSILIESNEPLSELIKLIETNKTLQVFTLSLPDGIDDENFFLEDMKDLLNSFKNSPLLSLNLSECHIDDDMLETLTLALQGNLSLRYLDLSSNDFSEDGLVDFIDKILNKTDSSLIDLNLSYNFIISWKATIALHNALIKNQNLISLDLTNTYRTTKIPYRTTKIPYRTLDQEMTFQVLSLVDPKTKELTLETLHLPVMSLFPWVFCQGNLLNLSQLKILNLSNNNIPDLYPEKFFNLLLSNETIESLSIGGNPIINDKNIPILIKALQINKTLKSLDLSHSEFVQENSKLTQIGVKTLLDALPQMKNITSLNLSGISLSLENIEALCEILKESDTITHLDLGGCSINSKGAQKIAQMLQCNQTLIELNLDNNPLTSEGEEPNAGIFAIFESLKTNDTLESLSLITVDNEKDYLWPRWEFPTIATNLSESLSFNTSITAFNSDLNLIDTEELNSNTIDIDAFVTALSKIENQISVNSQLQKLLLESPFITPQLIKVINQILTSKSLALSPLLPFHNLIEICLEKVLDMIKKGQLDGKKALKSFSMPKEISEILLTALKDQGIEVEDINAEDDQKIEENQKIEEANHQNAMLSSDDFFLNLFFPEIYSNTTEVIDLTNETKKNMPKEQSSNDPLIEEQNNLESFYWIIDEKPEELDFSLYVDTEGKIQREANKYQWMEDPDGYLSKEEEKNVFYSEEGESSKKRSRDDEYKEKDLRKLKKAKIEKNVNEKTEVTGKEGKEEILGKEGKEEIDESTTVSSTQPSKNPTLSSCKLRLFKTTINGETFQVGIERKKYYLN